MLIDFKRAVRQYKMKITGVVHVGAHWGQEYETYKSLGIRNVIFIEPCAEAFKVLKDKFSGHPDVQLFNYACADYSGATEMYVETANTGMSNSILQPKSHIDFYPGIVFGNKEDVQVEKLDELKFNRSDFNLLVMDCQGAEGLVIKGAKGTLEGIDIIYTEINTGELYEGCVQLDDLDKLLSNYSRIETKLTNSKWGDAIYRKNNYV